MRTHLLLAGILCTLLACGEPPPEDVAQVDQEIVGGEDAPEGALPYMANLFWVDEDDPVPTLDGRVCGGTLIDAANGLVLTAAHCVSDEYPIDGDWASEDPANWAVGVFPASSVKLTIGSHKLSEIEPDDYLDVVEIIAHPEFDFWDLGPDIAILRVAGVHPHTPTPRVIGRRLQDPLLVLPGRTATVAGWGRLTDNGETPDTLQWVRLPIIERNVCDYLHQDDSFPTPVTDEMMCAGPFSGARDACNGDSGGPLLVRDLNGRRVLAGIVSWGGDACGQSLSPGVYTNVLSLRSWLDGCVTGTHCERMPPLED